MADADHAFRTASLSIPWQRRIALPKNFFYQVEGGLGEVGGAAEVAPIVFVGAEGEAEQLAEEAGCSGGGAVPDQG